MATTESEQIQDQPQERQQRVDPAPVPADAPAESAPAPVTAQPALEAVTAERLRAEFAEVAAIASQAARLGVTVDAANALKKGVSPEVLRRSVLDTLAARAEASSIIAAAPTIPAAGDSPIVRRAKQRAMAARA